MQELVPPSSSSVKRSIGIRKSMLMKSLSCKISALCHRNRLQWKEKAGRWQRQGRRNWIPFQVSCFRVRRSQVFIYLKSAFFLYQPCDWIRKVLWACFFNLLNEMKTIRTPISLWYRLNRQCTVFSKLETVNCMWRVVLSSHETASLER